MATVTFTGESIEAVKQDVRTFFGMEAISAVEAPKKAGRPKKTVEEAVGAAMDTVIVETFKAPVVEAPPVASTAVTKDDVRAALQALAGKYPGQEGLDKVTALLKEHEAKNISALKPEQYPAVIADAGRA